MRRGCAAPVGALWRGLAATGRPKREHFPPTYIDYVELVTIVSVVLFCLNSAWRSGGRTWNGLADKLRWPVGNDVGPT